MEQKTHLLEEILNPSDEFTPIPFWFLNDAPDEAKIEQQLKDYVEKGVNGIVLHPRIGIPKEIPYLSDAYFSVIKFVVKTAAVLNMKIVLYDEGMYPSGSAHGMVVAANPEFASRGIALVENPGENPVLVKLNDRKYLVKCFTNGTIRGVHFGEDDGEADAPKSADILNPQAVKLFIHLTHDRYYEELKEYFGDTIIGFFTDEPCALGRNSGACREWADGLEQEIEAAGGCLKELEGLFNGTENRTTVIYKRLIKKKLRETFYAPLSKWCEEHGIFFMGHPAESDDVEEELYFHVPGQDLIMRRVVPKTGGLFGKDSVQAKLSADIARHLGRRRNGNECFGVCCRDDIPWYFTGEDMKWYIDWLAVRGVNLFVPHAFYYSVEGRRKDERPPDVGPNNICWKYYRRFSDYMKRLSFLMTDSVNCARIAVLCDNNLVPWKEITCLYENQIEFNYLPVAFLDKCVVEGGRLTIQEYQYDMVLNLMGSGYDVKLSGVNVAHTAEEILERAGSREGAALRTVRTGQNCKDLRVSHLIKNHMDIYLLSNEGTETMHTDLLIPGSQIPTAVNLWEGSCVYTHSKVAEEGVRVNLVLEPCETLLFLVDQTKEAADPGIQLESPEEWNARFALMKQSENQAFYEYTFRADSVIGRKTFEVTGEEMAECYCNGEFAGVSFWNPHRFDIGHLLHEGENDVKIVMTGNAANIYSNAGIFFGLRK